MTGLDLDARRAGRGRRAGHRLRAERPRRGGRRRHRPPGRGAGAMPTSSARCTPPPGCSTSWPAASRWRTPRSRCWPTSASTCPSRARRRWAATRSATDRGFLARDMPELERAPALPDRRRLLDQGAGPPLVPAGLLQRPREARRAPRAGRHPREHRGAASTTGRRVFVPQPGPDTDDRQGASRPSTCQAPEPATRGRRASRPEHSLSCRQVRAGGSGRTWWV